MNRSSGVVLAIGGSAAFLLSLAYLSLLEQHGSVGPVLENVRRLRLLFRNPTILLRRMPGAGVDGETLAVTYQREGLPAEPAPPDADEREIARYLFQNYVPPDGGRLSRVQVTCKQVAGGACSRTEAFHTAEFTRAEFEPPKRK
ncbi:MAG: hypothetical protein HYZ53_05440 [Planctomycetes bacterium]|nr:hypothetical protein [Planctomycetota bacterium]